MRRLLFVLSVVLALLIPHESSAANTAPLFFLERNINTNYVQYDVKLTADGSIDKQDPIDAYWIMRAKDGRREGLTRLERKLAYGYETRIDDRGNVWVTLVAHRERPLKLARVGNGIRAETQIAGRRAYLSRLYVQVREGGLIPIVEYVDIYGTDVRTGAALKERRKPYSNS